ncbi:MAG: FkbM family methyltransferase [Planctomycetaceae bacterium]|jgi:FkbM family methyltransferase|nr:FkbM family methyltransferase [Planctomycetaceae bacterium]
MASNLTTKLQNLKDRIATLLLYNFGGRVISLGLNDGMGGNFKEYCFDENMHERVGDLKKNLDADSIAVIDGCVKMMKYAPNIIGNWDNEVTLLNPKAYVSTKDKQLAREFVRNYKTYQKEYPLPLKVHLPEVFMFHCGLKCLPETVKRYIYISNKDIIDGGGYIGDSAVVFHGYNPKKIYSFDIAESNIPLFKKTMEMNKISLEETEFVVAGVGETDKVIQFDDNSRFDVGLNVHGAGEKKLQIRSIDSFAAERGLNVGFIKLDIEGSEPDAVRGMIETIRRDRPILSIAMYHNPHAFFEVKPYLESLDINYKWIIRQITPTNIINMPFTHKLWLLFRHFAPFNETFLIGYPAELEEKP